MSDSGFWNFSLRLYGEPKVAAACIDLQEHLGVDVNVLLYVLYAAHHGRSLDDEAIDRIEATVREWRTEVVIPLRAIRRRLKEPIGVFEPRLTSDLRDEVKRIELASERLQQDTLESELPVAIIAGLAPHVDDVARQNLLRYLRRLGSPNDAAVATILTAFHAR